MHQAEHGGGCVSPYEGLAAPGRARTFGGSELQPLSQGDLSQFGVGI